MQLLAPAVSSACSVASDLHPLGTMLLGQAYHDSVHYSRVSCVQLSVAYAPAESMQPPEPATASVKSTTSPIIISNYVARDRPESADLGTSSSLTDSHQAQAATTMQSDRSGEFAPLVHGSYRQSGVARVQDAGGWGRTV